MDLKEWQERRARLAEGFCQVYAAYDAADRFQVVMEGGPHQFTATMRQAAYACSTAGCRSEEK